MPKKKQARTDLTVRDQRTERSAVATAVSEVRGARGKWFMRSAEVAIETEWWTPTEGSHATPNSPAFVTIQCHTNGTDLPPGEAREVHICNEDVELGDLPLIVLALQEAIRIGVEQGCLPDLSGGAK